MKKIMLLLILVLSLVVTGCSNENQTADQNDEIEESGEGGILEEDESENKDNEWSYKYSIEIDERPIADEDIEINKEKFKIVFAENLNEELSSTSFLDNKEMLSGDRQDHLKIIGLEPTNTTWTDGTVVTALIYEFENVPQNTNFKLELSDELKEKLDLDNSLIYVHIK